MRKLRANYERELTRELRDAPVCVLYMEFDVFFQAHNTEHKTKYIKPQLTLAPTCNGAHESETSRSSLDP